MHRIFRVKAYEIVSQLKSPCPVPAYFVPNPNCCQLDYYRYLLNRDNTTTPAA